MKKLQIIGLLFLGIASIISVDLAHNYFCATFVELHDGITLNGIISKFIYAESTWSLLRFYNDFILSLRIVVLLAIGNIIICCIKIARE